MMATTARLRSSGTSSALKCVTWLYGREENAVYVTVAKAVRVVTKWLPGWALALLAWTLYWPVKAYTMVFRYLPVPLAHYIRRVSARLTPEKRRLVLCDQTDPAFAKHYTRDEAHDLFYRVGFHDVGLYHPHGYSWSVIGTKP
jgi:hypothetical protein